MEEPGLDKSEENPSFVRKHRKGLKAAVFVLCITAVFGLFNFIAQPYWEFINYNTQYGFYDEPEDTIETIFLGTSNVYSAVNPMSLYEEYGICSYNLSMDKQPMMASYYWLEEAYRLHGNTLDTVVLDVSEARKTPEEPYYHKSFDFMEFSSVKLRAVQAYSSDFEDFITKLIPALTYHDRWSDLTSEDVLKAGYEPDLCCRGFRYSTDRYINEVDTYTSILTPLYEAESDTETLEWVTESLYYLKEIIKFCNEHDIQLVLIKLPVEWTSDEHNLIQQIADQYGLDFLDFNVNPYCEEVGYSFATDFRNKEHANYYGAEKFTRYLGQYLVSECGNRDVRGDEDYAFMEEELEDYHKLISTTELVEETNFCDYISWLLDHEEYTAFLTVKGDGADALTDEQREFLASVGLTKLSELSENVSYIAVIDEGAVVAEQKKSRNPIVKNRATVNDMDTIEEIYVSSEQVENHEDNTVLAYNYIIPDWAEVNLISAGTNVGNFSSVMIAGEEYSLDKQGINIVVCDKKLRTAVDRVTFNTHTRTNITSRNAQAHLERTLKTGTAFEKLTGTDQILYQYDRACENQKLLASIINEPEEGKFSAYLTIFGSREDCSVYIAGTVDEALADVSGAEIGDRCLLAVRDGQIILEEVGQGSEDCEAKIENVVLSCSGSGPERQNKIKISTKTCTSEENGFYMVIFDDYLQKVIEEVAFTGDGVLYAD